jgi:hypothetical protein
MTVPSPFTWVDGAHPGAASLNPGVRDVDAFLLDPPHARAYRATAGTALPAGTSTAVNLDGETYDSTGTMHSLTTNLSRITVPSDGLYTLYGQVAGVVASGTLLLSMRVNAAGVATGGNEAGVNRVAGSGAGISTICQVTGDWAMFAGDHVELFATFPASTSPTPGAGATFMQARWVSQQ